ncbi:MAG: hypothetical protein ACJ8BW_11720 [Ktedonobacteraceae bacterium]
MNETPEKEALDMPLLDNPRFTPLPRNSHAAEVRLPDGMTDPIEIFKQFWPDEHMEGMVECTNEYARQYIEKRRAEGPPIKPQSRLAAWKPVTSIELHNFFGVMLHTGCDRKSQLKDYWRAPVYQQESLQTMTNHMTLRRFELIYKFFTISKSSLETFDTPAEPILPSRQKRKKSTSQKAASFKRFFDKLEPIASYIRETCKRVYIPGTHVTIDEAMVAFRGRTKHTTKLKNKPIKEGFKVWALAEHGYIWSWLW